MKRQSPLLLLLLIAFAFSPTVLSWILSTDGAWYRPYIIWLVIIVIAFFIQRALVKNHDL